MHADKQSTRNKKQAVGAPFRSRGQNYIAPPELGPNAAETAENKSEQNIISNIQMIEMTLQWEDCGYYVSIPVVTVPQLLDRVHHSEAFL